MSEQMVIQAGRLRRAGKVARIAIWMNWIVCAISWSFIVIEVESALVSGPLVLICGATQLIIAATVRSKPVALLGTADCAIVALFFGLVQLLHWGPPDAATPFALMGFAYVLGLLPLVVYAHRRAPRFAENCCMKCGYLLIGLTEPRCPECGTPFDPSTVRNTLGR